MRINGSIMTRQVYFLNIVLITLAAILFLFFYARQQEHFLFQDKLMQLLNVAISLEQEIDNSLLSREITDINTSPISEDDKVLALNKLFQLPVEKVSSVYPAFGMGLYSKELGRVIAIGPELTPEKLLSKNYAQEFQEFFEIYKTGKWSASITDNIGGDGYSVLNLSYPIYDNGKLIGHIWANMKYGDVSREIHTVLIQGFLYVFCVWLLAMVILRYIYVRLTGGLQKLALQIQNILNRINDGFFALDNEWRFTYINPVAEKFGFGNKNKLLGVSIWELIPNVQPYYDQYHRAKKENVAVHFQAIGVGTDRWIEVHAYPSPEGLSVYFHDITAKKQLEKEMTRLESLNVVAELAAGIGHEVRNPMTTVRGYLQWFQHKYTAHNPQFSTMIEELDRANFIITEFLSLAKNKEGEMKPGNLNNIIKIMLPLLQADALRNGHELHVNTGDIPDSIFNEKEIRQLILNLVRNGFEAMEQHGTVTVTTHQDNDNDEIVLTIQDTGTGIPETVLNHLGTPFLTTKETGTGLGLSVCYRIARKHKAKIEVKTSSQGTIFLVKFPVIM